MSLVRGFQVTQCLYAAASLGVADLLAAGPKSSAELAAATESHAPSMCRLLRALTAFGVFDEVQPDRFALTPLGDCLREDSPDSVRPLVLMFGGDNFWRTWGDLPFSIRTGQTAFSHVFGTPHPFEYYAEHREVETVVNAGMATMAAMSSKGVIQAFDFSSVSTVVDVGAGRGMLLSSILRAYPRLQGILFDLPHVVQAALPLLEEAGVSDRCQVVSGDMFRAVPAGGDCYLLSRVIHDWNDGAAIAILSVSRTAMPAGARILLVERVLPDKAGQSAIDQARFLSDLNMLVRHGGRERTEDEHSKLLGAAGLKFTRVIPTSADVSLVEGVRE
jgi:hypothetical protein